MVYCQELKCWCRAVIKSIVSSADHYLAECFLVDFAKYIPVKSKKYVRAAFAVGPLRRRQSVLKESVRLHSERIEVVELECF